MYTGVRCARRRNGKIDEYQTQCLAIGDGVDYEKLACNPVIDASQLPEGGSVHDFRDPKIWRDGDSFYAVIGNRCADGSGTILLYRSEDAQHWEFVSVVAAGNSSASSPPATTSTGGCGSARISSHWMGRTCCLSPRRR